MKNNYKLVDRTVRSPNTFSKVRRQTTFAEIWCAACVSMLRI